MRWRAYFEDQNGQVLRSIECWDHPEEAAMWGNAAILRPEAFQVEDPNGQPLAANAIEPEYGLTVEAD